MSLEQFKPQPLYGRIDMCLGGTTKTILEDGEKHKGGRTEEIVIPVDGLTHRIGLRVLMNPEGNGDSLIIVVHTVFGQKQTVGSLNTKGKRDTFPVGSKLELPGENNWFKHMAV